MRTAIRYASHVLVPLAAAVLLATAVIPSSGEEIAAFLAPTTITADATWHGRILVDATLTVPAGITLSIRPGASVIFTNEAGLTVHGILRAEGTAEQPVAFAAEGAGPWPGIVLANGDRPSRLRGCRILAARALAITAGDHIVEQCEIAAGTIGIDVTGDSARPVLKGNRIREMREGGVRCLGKSAPLVDGNTIERCGPFGVHASQGAVPQVQGNTISGCANGIELIQTAPYVRDNSVRECERGIVLSSADGGKPVQGNTVAACGTGIFAQHFSNLELAGNTVTGNKDGIVCFMGARPLIRNNAIRENETGISCTRFAAPTIEANAIERNRRGVFLTLSSYAVLRGNNLDGNEIQMELGNMSRDWERRVGKKPMRGLQQQAAVRAELGRGSRGAAREGDGLEVGGGAVEATGNWWGKETTREMAEKGPDANITGLRDWHDVPTLTYEGYEGEYVQDRIAYAPWAKERIAMKERP
jgi:parallel beta-helix repeat protein